MTTSALTRPEQGIVDAVSTERLMAATNAIAQWVRLSGTPEEAKAFDWIEAELKRCGLETNRYSHPALVSWPESASLVITGADGQSETIPCATHGFAASTPPGGLEADLVYVGRGGEEELRSADVAGKIILVDGIVAPNRNLLVEGAGIAGSIWIAGRRLHERILSPVWGTPTPETAHLLPKTPSVSVVGDDGVRIKAALERGPVRVRLETKVFQAWNPLPCLTGELRPPTAGPESDLFVMLSGHVDSWYYGAMDNGSANATMLEVTRLLAERRSELRRGLRVCFWSGHSHARYAGSAWYADTFWQELHDRCVAHVNVDSVGGNGATVLSTGNHMAELRSFASDAIEQIAGQRLAPRRYGRAGDQSFWGHGIPAMLMSLSEQPTEGADPVLLAIHHQISGGHSAGGGLGWWWHTPDDTVDKIDPDLLRRDAMIYALMVLRLCTAPVLPLDYLTSAAELKATVSDIQSKAGGHFDLAPVATELEALDRALTELQRRAAGVAASSAPDTASTSINATLMRVGRALIPVDYNRTGQFDHDLAVPTKPLPGLQAAATLPTVPADGADYQYLRTRLVRERNRVVHGIITARRAVEEALRMLPR